VPAARLDPGLPLFQPEDGKAGGRVDILARLERGLIVGLFAALTLLGVIQVVNRYLIRLPVWNIEQFLPHIFIVITYLGLGLGFRTKSHLAVSLIPEALPAGVRRVYELVLWLITLSFLAGLAWLAAGVVGFQLRVGARTNMGYPAAWLTATVVIGCCLGILRIVQVEIWPRLRRERRP
jgi:TRAP-type transport system small permease protein